MRRCARAHCRSAQLAALTRAVDLSLLLALADSIEGNMAAASRDTERGLNSVVKAQAHAQAGQSKLMLLCVILTVVVCVGLLWIYIFR